MFDQLSFHQEADIFNNLMIQAWGAACEAAGISAGTYTVITATRMGKYSAITRKVGPFLGAKKLEYCGWGSGSIQEGICLFALLH